MVPEGLVGIFGFDVASLLSLDLNTKNQHFYLHGDAYDVACVDSWGILFESAMVPILDYH